MNWTLGSECAPIRALSMKMSWSHECLFCSIMTSYLSKQWFWVGINHFGSSHPISRKLPHLLKTHGKITPRRLCGVKESLSSMQHVRLMKQRCSDMLLGLTSLPHQSGEMGKGIKLSYTTCNDRKNLPHKQGTFFSMMTSWLQQAWPQLNSIEMLFPQVDSLGERPSATVWVQR